MLTLSEDFVKTINTLVNSLGSRQYCIRGTASLVMQGIDMNVDDIDIICDQHCALDTNDLFKEYLIEPVSYKESDKFKSYFGKFNIGGVQVEVMGNWQIKDKNGVWSKIYDGATYNSVKLDGLDVKVTKIEDELAMFIAMGRFNAYQKIKKQLQSTNKTSSAQVGLFE